MLINWIDSQLTECACNLCGLRSEKLIYMRPDGLRVVQCTGCSFVYLNPRPMDSLIPLLYDSAYFMSPSSIGFDNYYSNNTRRGMLRASKIRLRVLKEAGISNYKKLVEIGCGSGEFCQVLHQLGVNVAGYDISESAIAEARSRYKSIPFHVGTIEDINPEERYDGVFAFEVIEHLPNPDSFFMKTSSLLSKNGFFCMTTPSFECGESVGLYNWIGFAISFEHMCFFSAATVAKFGEKHGMSVVCVLYGGGAGINNERKERRFNIVTKNVLNKLRMLDPLIWLKDNMLPIKHYYQSRELRHNLLIVLRKNN